MNIVIRTNKKRIIIGIAACIIIVGLAIGIFMFLNHQRYRNLTAYTKRLLDIDLVGCTEEIEGEVEISGWKREEYALIRLRVRDGMEEDAVKAIKKRCGSRNYYYPEHVVSGYSGHRFAKEIKEGEMYIYVMG